MRNPAQFYLYFDSTWRAFESVCFYVVVALIALAVGFVCAVMVLTKPTRSALAFAPLPAIAWDMPR